MSTRAHGYATAVVALSMTSACATTAVDTNAGQAAAIEPNPATTSPIAGLADAAFNAFNAAYLVTSSGQTYYAKSLSDRTADGTWSGDLDIQIAEDAYERTGSLATQMLINGLLETWLVKTPPPWAWDGWNDDIGWFSLTLARGYQMTGNAKFLTQAEYGYNFAFGRGWDAAHNGGGIWEEQPENGGTGKAPLSNDSLAQTAAMLYQSTGNAAYLAQAQQIYGWVRTHLFDTSSGEVFAGVKPDGTIDKSPALYNQGTFVDLAQLLYSITKDRSYYSDAQLAIAFTQSHLTANGVFTDNAPWRNTWAPEFARGLGHFVRANNLWSSYYPWMLQNAEAAWASRRGDINVTTNAWTSSTQAGTDILANWDAGMVAMLQFTPESLDPIFGTHLIVNKMTRLAVDNAEASGEGSGVIQWGVNGGPQQKWAFSPAGDGSWYIVSAFSAQRLDDPKLATANGTQLCQWGANDGGNQRWRVSRLADGSYQICNVYSQGCLDGSSSTENGHALVQWGWNGGDQQRWFLD